MEPNAKQCAACGHVYSDSDEVEWAVDDDGSEVCGFCYDQFVADCGIEYLCDNGDRSDE